MNSSGDTKLQTESKVECVRALQRTVLLYLCPRFHGNPSPGGVQLFGALILNVNGRQPGAVVCASAAAEAQLLQKSEPDGETIGCMIPLVFLLFLTKYSVWIHRLVPVPSVSAATTKSSKGTNNLSIFGSFDHLSCK